MSAKRRRRETRTDVVSFSAHVEPHTFKEVLRSMPPPSEQPSEPCPQGEGKGRVNRLLVGLPASTMHDSHTIGFVPVCRVIANWCCVKAFTCLQVRVLGGFNPQKKRRKPRKRQIAITGFGPQKQRKGSVQCQSLYMPRGQSPRRILEDFRLLDIR